MRVRFWLCVASALAVWTGGLSRAARAELPPKVEAPASADPLVGVYSGEHQGHPVKVTIRPRASGGYEGEIQAADERFEFTASAERTPAGPGLRGEAHEVGTGHEKFDFSAALAGDVLTLDDTAAKIKLKREGGSSVTPGGASTLEGDWVTTVQGQVAKMSVRHEGELFKGTLLLGEQKYEMEMKLTGDQVSGWATNPRGEREELKGKLENGDLVFVEKDDRITFTRPDAAPPSTLEGLWTTTVEGHEGRLILRAAGPDKYDAEATYEDKKSTGTLTLKGRDIVLVMKKAGGDDATLEGVIRGGRLVLTEKSRQIEFRRVTASEASDEVKMPSGITLSLPEGWKAKAGDSFTIVSVGEGEGDVRILLDDERLTERTQSAFVRSFVEFAEVFFLRPVGDVPASDEGKVKLRLAGERKDGTKIVGFAGIETREKIALGAMIFGPEADVERALEKAEKLLRSAKWPGEAALKVEVVPEERPKAPEAVPPAAPAPPPGPAWSKVELDGFEFASPPKWDVDVEKSLTTLTPPDDEDTVMVVMTQTAAAGAIDPLGSAMRRRVTEAAAEAQAQAKLVGEPRVLTVAGAKGAWYTFEHTPAADDADDAAPTRLLIGAVVAGDSVLMMVAHGHKDDMQKHAHELERVLQSIRPKAGGR